MEYFGLKLGQDLGNQAAHPYQKFRGVPPSPGKIGHLVIYPNCVFYSFLIGFTKDNQQNETKEEYKKIPYILVYKLFQVIKAFQPSFTCILRLF